MSTPTKARPKKPKHRPGQPENPEQNKNHASHLLYIQKEFCRLRFVKGFWIAIFLIQIEDFSQKSWFLKLINCKAETFNVFYDYSRIMNFSRILWIYAYLHSCKIAWIFGRLWTQKSRIFIRDIYYLCFTKSSEGCNTSFWKSSG